MDTCAVCCDKFNKSNHKKVTCPFCHFESCKTCLQKYILSIFDNPHCMNCKQSWDQTFVILNLNRNWFNNEYRNH